MEVDLLRPGTVPIASNTVLWFEFLLDQSLLKTHLEKINPDPSATDLIIKFTIATYESMKNETKNADFNPDDAILPGPTKLPLKVLALKILVLKVAAYIKWNLSTICSMPFKVQVNLLQDLLYFTGNEVGVKIPHIPKVNANPEEVSNIPGQYLFALVLYHRWMIATFMSKIHGTAPNQDNGDFSLLRLFVEHNNIVCTAENMEIAELFLKQALNWTDAPALLSYDCFESLTESSTATQFHWDAATPIDVADLRAQIHYDLGAYYFFREEYRTATEHFRSCAKLMKALRKQCVFASVDKDALDNYIVACGGESHSKNLFEEMNTSIANNYDGILNVLVNDNKFWEIPISQRIILEHDLIGGLSSGKLCVSDGDLLVKVQALNAVRCVIERYNAHKFQWTELNIDFLIWAAAAIWRSIDVLEKNLLASYFSQIIVQLDSEELLQKIAKHDILSDLMRFIDDKHLRTAITKQVVIPDLLKDSYWDIQAPNKNPKLEGRLLEQQIIACYNVKELRDLLVKLRVRNANRPIWKINMNWELPIPLQSVVTSIPRGFLQDFSYTLLAKSRELMLSKDFNSSISFLRLLEKEVKDNATQPKLLKLINWEILLVEISQYFDEWPALHIDRQELVQSCENCLKNTEMIPRTEVMEQCVLCLLNLARWDFLISFNKPWTYIEIASAIALACQDIVKFKGAKKINKDIWDLVIPIFAATPSSQSSKRSATGVHRDSPVSNNKVQLLSFLNRLRDATALSVLISLLARLYNLLRDDASITLNVDYVMLWPSTISSINSYNTVAVTEALSDLVLQALRYYPTNIPWLHLMGDLCFSNLNYDNSLRYYLQSLIVQTDYFNLPVRNDDHIFRRMIKCCTHLGCHTQAAVLCQFLEQPDYTLAFRSLVDFKSCNDSVEAYYHCFWDTSILEYLIHLHHKRGEFQRKKKAVQTIGMLELNSNNNVEIQREAVNLRKRTFLQAMCRQYVR